MTKKPYRPLASKKPLTAKQRKHQKIYLDTMKKCAEQEKLDALDGITPEMRWAMRFEE